MAYQVWLLLFGKEWWWEGGGIGYFDLGQIYKGGIKIGSGLNLLRNKAKPRDSGNGDFSETSVNILNFIVQQPGFKGVT